MTHLNAYEREVQDAEAALERAKGDLNNDKQNLHQKKVEMGLVKPKNESEKTAKPRPEGSEVKVKQPVDQAPKEKEAGLK